MIYEAICIINNNSTKVAILQEEHAGLESAGMQPAGAYPRGDQLEH
jgi:hypothetical protein